MSHLIRSVQECQLVLPAVLSKQQCRCNRHRVCKCDETQVSDLEPEKNRLKGQAARIAGAIGAAGYPPTLLQRLTHIEGMLDVDRRIANVQIPQRKPSHGEIREFVRKKLLDLPALLRDI